jgi:hypothetical protein
VADAWAKGANIPRSNLTTAGIRSKIPGCEQQYRKGALKTAASW